MFDGQIWYYASTSRLEDIQSELDALYLMGRPDCDIEANEIVKRFQINRDKKLKFSDRRVKDISIQDKREFLYAQSSLFQGRYQKSLTACYLDKYTLHSFYSSKGAELEHDFQTAGIACNLGLGFNGESFEEQFSRAAVSFMELKQKVSQVDIKEFIDECENFLINAVPVQPGSFPVVLSPIAAGVFAHESFGHKSEADFMIGDETLKREWALGKRVGPENLSIYDSGLIEGSGYTPYDDEGSAASKTYLIRDGVLTGRLHSVRTACELNESATATPARYLLGSSLLCA